MKLELTIKTSYLPNWGAYEGVRELIQNGKDAQTEFGATFEVRYRKDTGTLVIENEGTTLPHEALLFGHTSKEGRGDLIGKFGEGLKLGVLALVRAGHAVKIRSGSEVWSPAIERSDKFNAEVLVFNIDKGREPKNRVQVEIGGVTEESWTTMSGLFLFLDKLPKETTIKTDQGTLLLDPKYAHRVFVKGIFVQNVPELTFGYDLPDAEVDRDRKMIETYSLHSRTQYIWREAMVTRPDLIQNFIQLLETEASDVAGISEWNVSGLSDDVKVAAAASFIARHGGNAIPVQTLSDSKEVEHLGKTGIVCPKPLRHVLEEKLGTVTANKAKLAKECVKTFGWHELSTDEKANLERAIALVNGVTPLTLDDVDVIECRDPKILGLFSNGRVQLVKRILSNRNESLATLVHEAAHRIGGGDGEQGHVANIENIWSGIVARMTDKVS
jgi:hypothetical protein